MLCDTSPNEETVCLVLILG